MRRFANTLLELDAAGTAATARHRRERANGIVKLWTSSPTVAPIAGTRWAAYNAVTEYLDHVVPVRGARTAIEANTARALRTFSSRAHPARRTTRQRSPTVGHPRFWLLHRAAAVGCNQPRSRLPIERTRRRTDTDPPPAHHRHLVERQPAPTGPTRCGVAMVVPPRGLPQCRVG